MAPTPLTWRRPGVWHKPRSFALSTQTVRLVIIFCLVRSHPLSARAGMDGSKFEHGAPAASGTSLWVEWDDEEDRDYADEDADGGTLEGGPGQWSSVSRARGCV